MINQIVDSRPKLDQVTLVAVTSVALPSTIAALEASMRQAIFARVLLLSDVPPAAGTDPTIEWRRIERLVSRSDYSRFILGSLAAHIDTSYALTIQWDGFVLDGRAWDDEFLRFDYIGAVWPQFGDGHRVGNGGFSLRSKRLLERCKHLAYDGFSGEDLIICRGYRPLLEDYGVRFAPEDVASRFSYERTLPTGREFGFHGIFNLVQLLQPKQRQQLLTEIEPWLLTRGEHLEMLRWAFSRGDLRLAATTLSRLRNARRAGQMPC
jgi:hypothetical protein